MSHLDAAGLNPTPLPADRAGVGLVFLAVPGRARPAVGERLKHFHAATTFASDPREAVARLRADGEGVCVVDLAAGREVLTMVRAIRTEHPQSAVVGVSDVSNPLIAGEAWHAGVSEVLPWPFAAGDLVLAIANAREAVSIAAGADGVRVGRDVVFAHSAAMQRVVASAREAACTSAAVCLIGEPDTGRRLVARVIHRLASDAASRPFVMVECAGRSGDEIERELFGGNHGLDTPGRRTGLAVRMTAESALYRAHGGTLVLCDVADAPDRVQARLARVLRDGEALVGASRKVAPLSFRPIAIVEPSVDAAIAEGRLRNDLFARLHQVRVEVPPLRRRREDLPPLAAHFLQDACQGRQTAPKAFSRSALRLLMALPWTGNAAELKTMIQGVALTVTGPVVQLDDLLERANLDGVATRFEPGVTLREAKARFERECIAAVILRHRGRMGEAARALGIQRTNLYRKVRQLKVTAGPGLGRR